MGILCHKQVTVVVQECDTIPAYTGTYRPHIVDWETVKAQLTHDDFWCEGWQCPDGINITTWFPGFVSYEWDGFFRYHDPAENPCSWYPHDLAYPSSFCLNGYMTSANLIWDDISFPGEMSLWINDPRSDATYNFVGTKSADTKVMCGEYTNIPHVHTWGPATITIDMQIPPP